MKVMVDTHVLYWWLRDSWKLGERARALIADARAELLVSVGSFWEMSVKARIGKAPEPGSRLYDEARRSGFTVVPISLKHLETLESIPFRAEHKDQFDHLILAQTIAEDAMLITADRKLLAYGVRALRAR